MPDDATSRQHSERPAVFLDRDGVLIEDIDLLTKREEVRLLPGVSQALQMLQQSGYLLIVVSNQTVISRGLATEAEVGKINQHIQDLIEKSGGPRLDAFYVCPHHPKATLPAYRTICDCRKPEPGLFLRAAREHCIDLKRSFTVGDRITDIIAGYKSGGRTILVETGRHMDAPIETATPLDSSIKADAVCASLADAAEWILRNR